MISFLLFFLLVSPPLKCPLPLPPTFIPLYHAAWAENGIKVEVGDRLGLRGRRDGVVG